MRNNHMLMNMSMWVFMGLNDILYNYKLHIWYRECEIKSCQICTINRDYSEGEVINSIITTDKILILNS